MANVLYPSAKQLFISSGLNLSSLNIRIILSDSADYTYSSSHDNLDDVAAGARVSTSGNLASKTVTNGTFDAADVTLTAVTGDVSEQVIGYYHSGTESTSSLIFFFDTSISGAPVTPNGGDIVVQWNASGIFAL